MNEQLKEYLWNEWKFNTQPKYYKYFEEWLNNLTDVQIIYYENLWMKKDNNTIISYFV